MLHLSSYSVVSDDVLEQMEEVTTLVCHELRTSLTSIQGALSLLNYEEFAQLSTSGEKLLSIASTATNRLQRLASMLENQSETLPPIVSIEDLEKLRLSNEIACGLDQKEFFLDYQPIVSIEDTKVIGFEALARWKHPVQGFVSPEIFIPIAEKSGLIKPLGFYLLKEACQQLHAWQQEFPSEPPLTMSINLSSVQLSEPDLSQKVHQVLLQNNILPQTLRLEITESTLMENPSKALENLWKLRELGVEICLDDFGTGYSSLSRLQSLHVDALKIDKSFILSQNWILCEAIILLADRLRLEVIAEGVETLSQLQSLQAINCRKIQGYYFSRAMNSVRASQFLASRIS